MSCERKFKAAVNVIRNLPKNGSYQPAHDLMLRFYAYYKQATEGPNPMPKPKFWEVVKKAKWDAWSKLGNMSREQAMANYVEELKKIVETMAYTDNVAKFLTSLDSFYDSVPAEDLELLIGPVIDKVRSQPGSPLSGSPLASREASPQRAGTKPAKQHITSSLESSPVSSSSASPSLPDTDEEEEEDDFLDTYEQTEPERLPIKDSSPIKKNHLENSHKAMNGSAVVPVLVADNNRERSRVRDRNNANVNRSKGNNIINESIESNMKADSALPITITNGSVPQQDSTTTINIIDDRNRKNLQVDISEVIHQTLASMKKDIENLNIKVSALELKSRQMSVQLRMQNANVPVWWPFKGVSISSAVFFILWPFIVHIALVHWIQRRRTYHQTWKTL